MSSDDMGSRYTAFPDLKGRLTEHNAPVEATSASSWPLPTLDSHPDILISAWAHLLYFHTGDDRPVFQVDKDVIRFDISANLATEVSVHPNNVAEPRRTGIFHGEDGIDKGFDLVLRGSPADGSCTLISSGFLPRDHTPQLAGQLLVIADWLTKGSPGPIPWKSAVDLDLAVLNPHPQFMQGPRLLHHLPRFTSAEAGIAVDFLDPHGKRHIYTYADLLGRSDAFACRIRPRLAGSDLDNPSTQNIIPVLLPQGPDLYVAVLGILKAGAAFCPLDLDAPEARLKFVIGEVSAPVVVTDRTSARKFIFDGAPPILSPVVPTEPLSVSDNREDGFYDPGPEDLAYVMYTSGSTGTPKGVGVSHSAVTQSLLAHERHIPQFKRFLQFAAPAFDVFVFEMFFPLSRGCTLVSCNREELLSDLPGVMARMDVDAAELTPTVASGLLRRRQDVPSLKVLLTIGELLTRPIVESFGRSASIPGLLHGMYGPTEAAIHCTLVPYFSSDSSPATIGVPLDTVSAVVVQPHDSDDQEDQILHPVPVGQIGELAIGGHQLADGYLNNPKQTAHSFVKDKEYGKVYRSGDKARLLPDGNLEFLGRMGGGQVKLRGQRVELGEVECAAYKAPGIHAVTSAVVGGILVVFCATNDARASPDLVLQQCRRWLPSFMVPGDIVLLKAFPRLPSGKVDKKNLEREYEKTRLDSRQEDYIVTRDQERANWTDAELGVLKVFSSISGVPASRISRGTTIYQLGIDSLGAIKVAAELRKRLKTVSVADVMESPSLQMLAVRAGAARQPEDKRHSEFDFAAYEEKHRSDICSTFSIDPSEVEKIRPCTSVQAAMIAQYLRSEGSMYFNQFAMKLDRDVDTGGLRSAWQAAMKKYEMLRTGFASIHNGQHPFAMITYREMKAKLPWDDEIKTSFKSAREEPGNEMGLRYLNRLHDPPWLLSLIRDGRDTYLRFSALHALYDATSLQIILADVARAYNGLDLAAAERIEPVLGFILKSGDVDPEGQQQFWQYIGKEVHIQKFPCLTPKRARSGMTLDASRTCSWPASRLEKECAEQGVAVHAVGQVAWARVLSAYTGEDTVTFGLVMSGRLTTIDAENVAFPCITTLPMTCKVNGTNQELLEETMAVNSSMLKHQFTPLPKVQRWTGHAGEALFDTLFAFQKFSESVSNTLPPWKVLNTAALVDSPISIELEFGQDDKLISRITYAEDLVPEPQALLILDQLDASLIDTVSHLRGKSRDWSRLDVSLLSITPAKVPVLASQVMLLHEFVEENARSRSNKVALEWAASIRSNVVTKQRWTYSELDSMGNKVAHLLHSRGTEPGQLVGICFDKCPEASFAILGILKAGCAFVAIDPDAPVERKAFIVEDSGAKVILTMRKPGDGLWGQVKAISVFLDEDGLLGPAPTTPAKLARVILPDDTCYCLYTSGTTGTPKGCEITHENAVQATLSFQRLFAGRWDENSRFLQFASFHFDVSVLEQYWSWSVGICVTSAPRDLIFEDIARSISLLGITHIDLTPSLAKLVHPNDVPTLHGGVFITGGERLTQDVLDSWGQYRCMYNGYGPTEATIGCTMNQQVSPSDLPSNIGRQFDNVGTFVLHQGTNIPALRGAIGELCVSGKLVGRGYLNRPNLTRASFQHLDAYNERVYRTGDLVRLFHDGSFLYVGRADDQIKLRGQRLEVDEINEVIKSGIGDVAEIVTQLLRHPSLQKEQLVSFVVRRSSSRSRPLELCRERQSSEFISSIREACRRKLPGYMVPAHIVSLNMIPLSRNNKSDSKQLKSLFSSLPADDLRGTTAAEAADHAFGKEEESIVRILAEAVGVKIGEIRRDSSIFELGLDSITAIDFARSLREAGFRAAQTSVIMENNTFGSLAEALKNSQGSDTHRGAILATRQKIAAFAHQHAFAISRSLKIPEIDIEGIAPCTPLQEGMISRSLASESPLYFSAFYYELPQDVDTARLKEAWTKVVDECQILRTRFVPTVDGYAQVALRDASVPWEEVTLACEDALGPPTFHHWYQQNRRALEVPFKLVIFRFFGGYELGIFHHHALFDDWSHNSMLSLVLKKYRGLSPTVYGPGFHSVLAEGPLCHNEGARQFWTEQLAGSPQSKLPAFGATNTKSGLATQDVVINGLERTRRALQTTHQALVQACWIAVLHRRFSCSYTIGVLVSGRAFGMEGIEDTIGPLFNTLPSRIEVEQGDTWASLVRKCHSFNTAALPYQHTPLRDIMKWCGVSTERPLFEVLFSFQREVQLFLSDSQEMKCVRHEGSPPDFPLAFEALHCVDDSLRFSILAQDGIADLETSQRLLLEMKETLESLVVDPRGSISGDTEVPFQFSNRQARDEKDNNPRAATERTLTGFDWTAEALQLRREVAKLAEIDESEVQESSSILEMGLDSIDAIKLSSRLKRGDIILPVGAIMRSRTIGAMARELLSNKKRGSEDEGGELKNVEHNLRRHFVDAGVDLEGIDEVLPATPLQEAMVAEMISSDFHRYFNLDVLKLKVGVDAKKLREAWFDVISNTSILRSSFVEINDSDISATYALLVHHTSRPDWTDVGLAPNYTRQQVVELHVEQARAWAASHETTPARLAKNPPLTFTIVDEPDGTYVVFSISHALYDGHSMALMHHDLQRAYNGIATARTSYRPILERIMRASGPEAARFWKESLSNVEPNPFPQRRGKTSDSVHQLEKVSSFSPPELQNFCKSKRVTLQTLGQTVWIGVLAYYLGKLDVVFGMVLSGRDSEEENEVIFPTMNTVAVRAILHGSRFDMLQYVQEIMTTISQFQHFPLRKAQAFAKTGGGRLLDTLFIYQKRPDLGESSSLYESVAEVSEVEFPVCVEMETVGESLVWRTACKDHFLSSENTETLLGRLDAVLRAIVESPDAPTVTFSGHGCSIIGLAPTQLAEGPSSTADGVPRSNDVSEDEEWAATGKVLRKVLSAVSKVPEDDISMGMTLFHLGLDSISAIKVSSLLRKEGVQLSVSEMLRAATVEKMAQAVESPAAQKPPVDTDAALARGMGAVDANSALKAAGIDPNKVERVMPATAGQVYMLSLWQQSNGALFFPTFSYSCKTMLNPMRLERAWQRLTQQASILRTTFVASDQDELPILQVILKSDDARVEWRPEHAEAVPEGEVHHPTPPVALSAQADGEGILLSLRIHHALYDAVSLPLLVQRLQRLFLLPGPGSGGETDMAEFLTHNIAHSDAEKRKSFWSRHLYGAKSTLIQPENATAFNEPRVEIFRPSFLDAAAVQRLEADARHQGVSTQAVFLAAHARTYARLTQGSDAVFGIYLANRSFSLEGVSTFLAPTLNLVPLRVVDTSRPLLAIARSIIEDLQAIGSVQNACVSLAEVAAWTGVRVNCFVNFLKLPAAIAENLKGHTLLQQAGGEKWAVDRSEVNPVGSSTGIPPHLKKIINPRGAYLPAVDIEATISPTTGALSVGVFGPANLLGLEEAEALLADLRTEIEAAFPA